MSLISPPMEANGNSRRRTVLAALSARLGVALLAPILAGAVHAGELACICQQQLVCGADSCDPGEDDFCGSTDIRISLAQPSVTLCVFSYCLEGEAALSQVGDDGHVLTGSYRPSTAPELNETSVTAFYDASTGVGFIQTADEEAVAQYSVICREPG